MERTKLRTRAYDACVFGGACCAEGRDAKTKAIREAPRRRDLVTETSYSREMPLNRYPRRPMVKVIRLSGVE